MDQSAIDQAATLLAEARLARKPLDALPEQCRPADIAEGHAIQDALVARLGEPVVGWKTAGVEPGKVMRGAILASRLYNSPARIEAASMPLLGIEAEIAFRFERPLPPREAEYAAEEVAAAVVALPAIEIVDTRFASYGDTALLDRLGDCMSNGALIIGAERPDWRSLDLAALKAVLKADGAVVVEKTGGHANGDPILPTVALANLLRSGPGIAAGLIVTAGTYTGLEFQKPGQAIEIELDGFAPVSVELAA